MLAKTYNHLLECCRAYQGCEPLRLECRSSFQGLEMEQACVQKVGASSYNAQPGATCTSFHG